MTPSVLAAGYVPLDIIIYRGRVVHAAGGTAGNVAAILSFLGWKADVAAEIGSDMAGRRVKGDLRRANVDVRFLRSRTSVMTPRVVHEIGPSGHRFLFSCPKCEQRLPSSRPLSIERAHNILCASEVPSVFFFDRLNPGTLVLAETYAESGSLVVFEPSKQGRADLMQRAMNVSDVVKHASDRKVGVDAFGAPKGQIRVVTLGDRGAKFRVGEGSWHHCEAYPYPVVDAGGAGDWTTSGLIQALVRHGSRSVASVGDAMRWAQALAAVSCGAPGARGLARQQSAEMVVRNAQFVEQRRLATTEPTSAVRWNWTTRVGGSCAWCLLAETDGSKAEVPVVV